MPLSTYQELKAAVADYLIRDDLTSQIIDFITLAEAELNRTLFVAQREEAAEADASEGVIALPDDFYAMRSLYIDSNPKVFLQQMSMGALRTCYSSDIAGMPQNFAIQSGSELVLAPAPDTSYTVVMNYYQAIPALSDIQTTNWLLASHPDIYLFGSLLQAQYLIVDDERASIWRKRLSEAIEQLQDSGVFMAYGGSPLRIRSPYTV